MARNALSSRAWLNIALAVVVLALAAVAWWPSGDESAEPEHRLTDVEPDAVERLTIERPDGDDIELERVDGSWRMLTPMAIEADAARVQRALAVLGAESHARYPVTDLELGDFGLHHPEAALIAGDTKLVFGGTDPLDNRRYVRAGDRVHLIDDSAFRGIDRDWTGFVSRRLVPRDASIASIELPDFTVHRAEDGGWRVESKDAPGASPDAARRLVEAWRGASALSVEASPDDAPAEASTVTLALTDPERALTFHVTRKQRQLLLTRPDLGLTYRLLERHADGLLDLETSDEGEESSSKYDFRSSILLICPNYPKSRSPAAASRPT